MYERRNPYYSHSTLAHRSDSHTRCGYHALELEAVAVRCYGCIPIAPDCLSFSVPIHVTKSTADIPRHYSQSLIVQCGTHCKLKRYPTTPHCKPNHPLLIARIVQENATKRVHLAVFRYGIVAIFEVFSRYTLMYWLLPVPGLMCA